MLEPQIVEKPALTVVGVEASFIHALSPEKTNFQVIPPLWDKLEQLCPQIRDRIGDTMYGIIYGRPESERQHPHELQYIAGAPVSSTDNIPPGMVAHTIPATTYAVVLHRGPIQKIGDTVYELYRDWLPQSGYQHSEIADVELYDHRFCFGSEDSVMEYWISVAPRT